jgi:protein SCO1
LSPFLPPNALRWVTFAKNFTMRKKWLVYVVFFAVLLAVFYFFLFRITDFSKSKLAVINDNVRDFSFTTQDGQLLTQRNMEGKVYVAAYFFTTCKGICPKMNANMRRVYDAYKNDSGFAILSHTCMPETDSVPVMKAYSRKMVGSSLVTNADGSVDIDETKPIPENVATHNWYFLTGDKTALYKMARESYIIDNNQQDTAQKISDQFIHTQFFSLVDKQLRVRGIYDGLKTAEVNKLIADIKELLAEKAPGSRFMNGFSNVPK